MPSRDHKPPNSLTRPGRGPGSSSTPIPRTTTFLHCLADLGFGTPELGSVRLSELRILPGVRSASASKGTCGSGRLTPFRFMPRRHGGRPVSWNSGPELDEAARSRTGPAAAACPRRRPRLVRPGLVFPERGGAALGLAAEMAGDLPALVEDVDHRSSQPHIDLLADILVGHRVEVPLDGDVVIGVDRVLAPLRALPAPVRQGPHVGGDRRSRNGCGGSRPCHRHRGAR